MLKAVRCLLDNNFLWGAATAGYQIEGDDIHSQWYEWEKDKAAKLARKAKRKYGKLPYWSELQKTANQSSSYQAGKAANSYNEYWRDVKLLKELNMNAYRMSIEWSRIEPTEGQFDQVAISHYVEMINLFRKNHIEVMVTLFHFSFPIWFGRKGGFHFETRLIADSTSMSCTLLIATR